LPLELRKLTGPFLKNPLAFFIPNLFLFAFDAVNCYLLGLHLHVTIGKEKKLTQRQRNRAMMAKDHKGSVRIDTNYEINFQGFGINLSELLQKKKHAEKGR
jgi:hypothetical protein